MHLVYLFCSFDCSAHPRALHSFPTRRSSDLPTPDTAHLVGAGPRHWAGTAAVHAPSFRLLGTRTVDRLRVAVLAADQQDRKSTRLNSSHSQISYAVFCLKKKTKTNTTKPIPI